MSIEIIAGGGIPDMGGFIAHSLSNMHPSDAQAMLGALCANIVGNIPEENWEEIKKAAQLPCECGDPGCGEAVKAVIIAGEIARKQFNRVIERNTPESPEEKGFSE